MAHPPVIDVSGLDRELAGAAGPATGAIADACAEWGFFQVVGHGIAPTCVQDLERAMAQFFSMPEARKQEVARSETNAWGYYDRELTKNTLDWKQVFDYGTVPHPELPDEHPSNRSLDGNNRWPADLPGFREPLLAYMKACEGLSYRLLGALCVGLGLPANHLDGYFEPHHTSFVRLNYYPRCEEPSAHFGVNHHSDAGALTVLHQSDAECGLQVLRDARWIDVAPEPGAFVINTGDMLQVWSNDRYRAPLHRVVVGAQERYSAPYFFNPSPEAVCEPLPVVVDASPPKRYRPVPWGHFRRERSAGDYTERGEEIQIAHYRVDATAAPGADATDS